MFESIVLPIRDQDSVVSFVSEFKDKFRTLQERDLPWISSIPVFQGIRWIPTWKALPSHRLVTESIKRGVEMMPSLSKYTKFLSCFPTLWLELMAYQHLMIQDHALEQPFSSGVLWAERIRYALDPKKTFWVNHDLTVFERTIGPVLPSPLALKLPFEFGKLGMSLEGGGKRRFFALG